MIRKITTVISRYDEKKDTRHEDSIFIESHGIHNDRVRISIPGIEHGEICVLAEDLKRAIDNATNHRS